jgi:glutathione S-transferase
VPALALSTGEVLIQSLAIIEYLDEIEPKPATRAIGEILGRLHA